jgi:uncharacterized protein (TIGR03437 family)
MKAIIGISALLLAGTVAQAATTNTTLTVNATGTLTSTAASATGTATMPGIFTGTAAFSGTLPLSGISGLNAIGSFTITAAGGTLTGTLSLPLTLLEGIILGSTSSGTGSATITGGSGSYSGYSGSFPALAGSGASATTGFTLTFSGAGTINSTGGTTITPTPTITAVQNAAGYSANIAEGSIFIVKGTNLSPSGVGGGYLALGFPLPTSSNGVSINFTPIAVGPPTTAYLIYLYNQNSINQLAAILPSTLAAGKYNVTVTNGSVTSAPFPVTVVQSQPGLFTQDTSGTGLVVVQNYVSASETDVDRFTTGVANQETISPAKPGQTLIAWATGLGPITTGDNSAAPFLNFLPGLNVQVIVGGMSITPTFAGRAPTFAGEDQINFVLPSNVPTGCTVSFQVSVNGVLSNATFLSIAPSASATACAAVGLTTAQLQNLDNGGTLTGGNFSLEQFSGNIIQSGASGAEQEQFASAAGGFTQVTGFQLASSPVVAIQPGACLVTQGGSPALVTSSGATYLDAGAVTLTGPSGSNITNAALTESGNLYNLAISEQFTPPLTGVTLPGIPNASIVPGTYTLKGAGGSSVGPFTASITLGTPLTITGGLPTSVNRGAGLTLNWTGGNSTDTVEIYGSSGTTGSNGSTTSFICYTTAGPGTFTVPASILGQLPAVTAGAISAGTGSGFLGVFSSPTPASGNGLFSAPLTSGGSIGNATFLALLGVEGTAAYQ